MQIILTVKKDGDSKADLASTINMVYAIRQLLNLKYIKIILIG